MTARDQQTVTVPETQRKMGLPAKATINSVCNCSRSKRLAKVISRKKQTNSRKSMSSKDYRTILYQIFTSYLLEVAILFNLQQVLLSSARASVTTKAKTLMFRHP